MVRGVDRIEQDLAALEEVVSAIAQELQATYDEYFNALGEAVRQQLIQASYHLCTHGYPEQFLDLSFSERQQLQQALRQVANDAQRQLTEQLQSFTPSTPAVISLADNSALLEALPGSEASILLTLPDEPLDEPPATDAEEPSTEPPTLKTPKAVIQWQEKREKTILLALKHFSHETNRTLQQANVLSQQLPEPVLEVAAKSDLAAEAPGPPNLLNFLVEAEVEDEQEAKVTHILAVRLRLSEIEFNVPPLSTWRSKIRNLSSRLSQMDHDYQKTQRELAIAQAESAWRSSWYEA